MAPIIDFLERKKTIADTVSGILLDYIPDTPGPGQLPFPSSRSLREDLGIESLSLVSVVLRIADELGVDAMNISEGLHSLRTVGDLLILAKSLQTLKASKTQGEIYE